MALEEGSGNPSKGAPDSGGDAPVSQEELDILGDVPPLGEDGKKVSDDEDDEEDTPPAPKEKKAPVEEDEEDSEDETEESEDDSEDDEEDEEEKETSEETEDEDDVEQPSVNFKEINKEFPGLLKKHPELRAAVARDFSYRKLYPSIDDAKDAADKAQAMDFLGSTVQEGNFEPLLKSIGKDPENLKRFAKEILPTLGKVDKSLRAEAVTPAIKSILRNALATGNSTKNASLANAAQHLAAYLFEQDWKSVFEAPRDAGPAKEDPEKTQLKERLHEAESSRERDFVLSVKSETYSELENEAKKIFIRTEKETGKKLTERQKKTIFQEAHRKIGQKLQKNDVHQAKMDRLFSEAKKAGYTSDRKPSVKSAYLGRAKNLLSEIQLKLIREELGVTDTDEVDSSSVKTKGGTTRIPPQPSRAKSKGVEKDPNKAFKNMTEDQFLEA